MRLQINVGFTFLELLLFISLSLVLSPSLFGKTIYRLMRQRVSVCDATVDEKHFVVYPHVLLRLTAAGEPGRFETF